MNDADAPPSTLDRIKDTMTHTNHRAKSLLNTRIPRCLFDPTSAEDRLAYLVFMKTGRWIKQFYFEPPDTNVVSMIQRKLLEYALRSEEKKAERIIKELSGREVITSAA